MTDDDELIARIPPDIAGIANDWAEKLPDVSRTTIIAMALMIDREQQRAAIIKALRSEEAMTDMAMRVAGALAKRNSSFYPEAFIGIAKTAIEAMIDASEGWCSKSRKSP